MSKKIKQAIGVLFAVLGIIGLFLSGAIWTTYQFSHPELTQTQLFLILWPEWVVSIVAALCLLVAINLVFR